MSIKRPISQAPVQEDITDPASTWNKWFDLLRGEVVSIAFYSVTFNPASVAANSVSSQNVTVPGVVNGDYVLHVRKPTHTTNIAIGSSEVVANNTIAVRFINPTGGAIDPPSETYEFIVLRG